MKFFYNLIRWIKVKTKRGKKKTQESVKEFWEEHLGF